ncbi:hypothetical protein HYFRA_00006805 [Hymenoscyphus fraxineus]|uniref:BTB domain-containing protein n=1 Tax=Hymenoscyphus fraxineus TaxID=746836 RepID=A0A9N9KQR1_9HELO|nr:hypothetical protein HYFRA_00006805 [Hymenoscyphus fraxineus]
MSRAPGSSMMWPRLGNEIVTIFVGPDSEVFKVHKTLICMMDFFDRAFNGRFLESSGELSLPEDDPSVIHLLVDYLYLGNIPCPPIIHLLPEATFELKKQHISNLFSLYVFAEEIDDAALMNNTMDTVQSLCHAESFAITFEALLAAYENTKPNSKLRLFTSELFIYVHRQQNNGEIPADEIRALVASIEDQDLLVDLFMKNGERDLRDPRMSYEDSFCYLHTRCHLVGNCQTPHCSMVSVPCASTPSPNHTIADQGV